MSQLAVPKEYQDIALDFLLKTQRAALWMVPGMGKTLTVYLLLDILKLAGSKFFPALVIAPKQVCDTTWPDEQEKWSQFANMKVVRIGGSAEQRLRALHTKADIFVINFENVEWLVEVCGANWPFRIVIVDEATKLKGYRSKQGGKRAEALASVARQTGRFIELTGTPVPNGLKDLWGQIWFLDFGGRLGQSYKMFLQRWFIVEAYTRQVIPREGAKREIEKLLADCTLAFRAEDWFDIKEPVVSRREVRLPDEATKLYRKMERDFFIQLKEVDAEITARIALTLTSKLLQLASGSVFDDGKTPRDIHDAKLDALDSLLNELNGENVIVVYNFTHEAARIRAKYPHARLYRNKKDETDWNAGKVPLLLLQPQAGGHGTNLQHGGRTMVFFSPMWDLELRMQVAERIGPVRQAQAGYDRAVLHYDIVASNTLDEEVLERLTSKRSVQEALMLARAHRA